MYEASVNSISEPSKPGVCLSCTFLAGSCADGCAVKLENDELFTLILLVIMMRNLLY